METTSVPVNLTLEAARYVVRLGCWDEFEAIVRGTRERIPEARAISVWLDQPYLPNESPKVLIYAEIESPPRPLGEDDDPREKELDHWVQGTFAPDISRHFVPMILGGYNDDER